MPRIRLPKTTGLLLLLAAAGFFLRIHSLSHDLDLGIVYHPDTPKQMVAATKYLQSDYFYRVGNLNYDGYPFFNSRLAAWCYRIIAGPVNGFARHIGLSEPLMQPTLQTFFWITRFLNCLLSTLSIPVAFFLTRRLFNEKAGWLAALMVLLSPLEIMASHTAMNDTGAAFFAFLCLWICVEISFQKKPWLYCAFAAAFACGFFTKYHAALALIPLVLCHLIRFPRRRNWISKAFWIPVLLTTLTGILAAGIANPALALDPRGTFQLIIDFMEYTSNFGMSDEIRALSPLQRWGFGLTHNLPSFRSALTLPALLLAPLGLLLFFRKRPACWITASMALVYLGVALPFKPLAQPQYHTLVLPIFFVLCAGTLLHLFSLPRWKIVSAPLAALLSGWILWGLYQQTDEVLFYYRLSNSRLLAERWMDRNVPKTFRAAAGHYTLVRQPPHVENPDGRIMLSSSFRPHRAPENPDLVTTLNMQDEAFSSFRNPVITLYLHRTDWLNPPVTPSFLFFPAPAPATHNVLFAGAPDFLQTPAMIEGTG
ncbi:MAG: ArnT family glycosyltransferase, partial [Kiritimatiellia bacterium]